MIKKKITHTTSSLSCWQQCQRLYELKYVKGYRPEGDEEKPLWFGSLCHNYTEASVAKDYGMKMPEEVNTSEIAGTDLVLAEVCSAVAHNALVDIADEVVELEGEFLNKGVYQEDDMAGKYDAVIMIGKDMWVVDYKFTSGLKMPQYWTNLPQGDNYIMALEKKYDRKVRGVIWINVNKPTTKPILVKDLYSDGKEYKVVKLDKDGNQVVLKSGKVSMTTATRRENLMEYGNRLSKLVNDNLDDYLLVSPVIRNENELSKTNMENRVIVSDINRSMVSNKFVRTIANCEKFNKLCAYSRICNEECDDVIQSCGFVKVSKVHGELDMDF